MFVEKIPYTDYNGNKQEFVAHFNLTPAEILKLEMNNEGGLEAMIHNIIQEKDNERLYAEFEKITKTAYGKKSPDGLRFIKNEEVFLEFKENPAYSEFFVKLFTDPDYASKFIKGAISMPNHGSVEPVQGTFEVVRPDVATANTGNPIL